MTITEVDRTYTVPPMSLDDKFEFDVVYHHNQLGFGLAFKFKELTEEKWVFFPNGLVYQIDITGDSVRTYPMTDDIKEALLINYKYIERYY